MGERFRLLGNCVSDGWVSVTKADDCKSGQTIELLFAFRVSKIRTLPTGEGHRESSVCVH